MLLFLMFFLLVSNVCFFACNKYCLHVLCMLFWLLTVLFGKSGQMYSCIYIHTLPQTLCFPSIPFHNPLWAHRDYPCQLDVFLLWSHSIKSCSDHQFMGILSSFLPWLLYIHPNPRIATHLHPSAPIFHHFDYPHKTSCLENFLRP